VLVVEDSVAPDMVVGAAALAAMMEGLLCICGMHLSLYTVLLVCSRGTIDGVGELPTIAAQWGRFLLRIEVKRAWS